MKISSSSFFITLVLLLFEMRYANVNAFVPSFSGNSLIFQSSFDNLWTKQSMNKYGVNNPDSRFSFRTNLGLRKFETALFLSSREDQSGITRLIQIKDRIHQIKKKSFYRNDVNNYRLYSHEKGNILSKENNNNNNNNGDTHSTNNDNLSFRQGKNSCNKDLQHAYQNYQEKKIMEIQQSKTMVDDVQKLTIANLRQGLRFSAKCNNLNRALILYEEMKRRNVNLSNGDLSSIIYLCCSSGNVELALLIYEETVLDSFEVDENTFSILIRGCAEENRIDKGFELILHMLKQNIQPRLRSYSPILSRLWENQDLERSRQIWKHMIDQNVLPLEEHIINQIVCYGMLGKTKEYLKEISDLFDLLSETVMWISTDSMNKLYSSFEINHGINIAQQRKIRKQKEYEKRIMQEKIENGESKNLFFNSIRQFTINMFQRLFKENNISNNNSSIKENTVNKKRQKHLQQVENSFLSFSNTSFSNVGCEIVQIHRNGNGTCSCCNTKLDRITLTLKEREKVRKALGSLSLEKQWTPKYQKRMQNNPNVTLESFASWLDSKPYKFDVVLDAPNIAYFGQNYQDGKFRHYQIEKMVNYFQEQGKNVLIIIPSKYTVDIIPNHCKKNKNETNTLSEYDSNLLSKWEREGILYKIPLGQNDDWYWMYATVHEHERRQYNNKQQKKSLLSTSSSPSSLSPTVVITNDHMRDHRLSLLEPRPFSRWRASQVIRYRFLYDYFDQKYNNSDNTTSGGNNDATDSITAMPAIGKNHFFDDSHNDNIEDYQSTEDYQSNDHIVDMNFFETASFSREIHRSNFAIDHGIKKEIHKNKIHIPCEEQNIWLCIDLEKIEGKRNF